MSAADASLSDSSGLNNIIRLDVSHLTRILENILTRVDEQKKALDHAAEFEKSTMTLFKQHKVALETLSARINHQEADSKTSQLGQEVTDLRAEISSLMSSQTDTKEHIVQLRDQITVVDKQRAQDIEQVMVVFLYIAFVNMYCFF